MYNFDVLLSPFGTSLLFHIIIESGMGVQIRSGKIGSPPPQAHIFEATSSF